MKMKKLLVLIMLAFVALGCLALAVDYLSVNPFIVSVTLDGVGPLKMRFGLRNRLPLPPGL
jgi:hypothetical protein